MYTQGITRDSGQDADDGAKRQGQEPSQTATRGKNSVRGGKRKNFSKKSVRKTIEKTRFLDRGTGEPLVIERVCAMSNPKFRRRDTVTWVHFLKVFWGGWKNRERGCWESKTYAQSRSAGGNNRDFFSPRECVFLLNCKVHGCGILHNAKRGQKRIAAESGRKAESRAAPVGTYERVTRIPDMPRKSAGACRRKLLKEGQLMPGQRKRCVRGTSGDCGRGGGFT